MGRFIKSFEVTTRWTGAAAELTSLGCPPQEVGSQARQGMFGPRWFPEALLVAAIETDLMDRFARLARQQGLRVLTYESSAIGQLSGEDQRARLTAVVLRPQVAVEHADPAAIRALLTQALAASDVVGALNLVPQLQPTVLRSNGAGDVAAQPSP